MAKKSRRARAKYRAAVAKPVQGSPSEQPVAMPARMQAPARMAPKSQDLASRYQYVMPEVKRIGIIAGSIIVVLIILSFVLG